MCNVCGWIKNRTQYLSGVGSRESLVRRPPSSPSHSLLEVMGWNTRYLLIKLWISLVWTLWETFGKMWAHISTKCITRVDSFEYILTCKCYIAYPQWPSKQIKCIFEECFACFVSDIYDGSDINLLNTSSKQINLDSWSTTGLWRQSSVCDPSNHPRTGLFLRSILLHYGELRER